MNYSRPKYNLDIDLPMAFFDFLSYDLQVHPNTFYDMPLFAQMGLLTQWLLTLNVGITIDYINEKFHALAYPLPGCEIADIYGSSIYNETYVDALSVALVYSIVRYDQTISI